MLVKINQISWISQPYRVYSSQLKVLEDKYKAAQLIQIKINKPSIPFKIKATRETTAAKMRNLALSPPRIPPANKYKDNKQPVNNQTSKAKDMAPLKTQSIKHKIESLPANSNNK